MQIYNKTVIIAYLNGITYFSGSETIYGTNEHENYARFSLADEEKPLDEKQELNSIIDLRYAMEKFKILDNEATFVFSDKELMQNVMNVSSPDLKVLDSQIKLVENLEDFNK